jgi:hypothetical protein
VLVAGHAGGGRRGSGRGGRRDGHTVLSKPDGRPPKGPQQADTAKKSTADGRLQVLGEAVNNRWCGAEGPERAPEGEGGCPLFPCEDVTGFGPRSENPSARECPETADFDGFDAPDGVLHFSPEKTL